MGDGTLFMAMEFIDGESLEERIRKGPMPLQRAAAVVDGIADALGEAHRRGVIHRDVKPSNVMLASRVKNGDFVKVLDFGVARLEGTEVTTTGMVCGTPKYMSPEQLRGEKIDGRADLYSLGVVLYELVTGRPPFSAENAMGYVYQHASVKPPRPSEVAPKAKIPPSLDAFLERALAKLPRDRPATAEIFRDELKRAVEPLTPPAIATTLQSERVGAAMSSLVVRLGDEARALTARVRPRKKPLFERVLNRLGVKPRRPWYREPKWIAIACATVAAVVCLGWLLLFWG
jgi:serine/threonine-protein kinase